MTDVPSTHHGRAQRPGQGLTHPAQAGDHAPSRPSGASGVAVGTGAFGSHKRAAQLLDLPLSLLFELTTVLIVLQLFTLVTRLFLQFVALI
jgi:hypothetical protein